MERRANECIEGFRDGWMDGWMDRRTDGPTNRLIDRQTNGYIQITSTPVIDLFSSKANTNDGRALFPNRIYLKIALELCKCMSRTNLLRHKSRALLFWSKHF